MIAGIGASAGACLRCLTIAAGLILLSPAESRALTPKNTTCVTAAETLREALLVWNGKGLGPAQNYIESSPLPQMHKGQLSAILAYHSRSGTGHLTSERMSVATETFLNQCLAK